MIVGIVQDYTVQEKTNNHGPYFLHAITVGDIRYSCFGVKGVQNANPGDKVSFEEVKKGEYWNFEPKTFKVLERGAVPMPKQPVGGSKDDRILRQNAMAHATAVVVATSGKTVVDTDMVKRAIHLADNLILPYTKEGVLPNE